MKVNNPDLLKAWPRTRCERCHQSAPCQAHHCFTQGSGKIDARPNLLTLCAWCHGLFHNGKEDRDFLLGIVAGREGISSIQIIYELVWMIRRLPKDPNPQQVINELRSVCNEVRELGAPIIREELERRAALRR